MFNEPADDKNWGLLKKEISKVCNFDCSNYNDSFLKRRVQTRIRANKSDSYKDYALFLSENLEEGIFC